MPNKAANYTNNDNTMWIHIYKFFLSTFYTTFNIYLTPFYKFFTKQDNENTAIVTNNINIDIAKNIISYN